MSKAKKRPGRKHRWEQVGKHRPEHELGEKVAQCFLCKVVRCYPTTEKGGVFKRPIYVAGVVVEVEVAGRPVRGFAPAITVKHEPPCEARTA